MTTPLRSQSRFVIIYHSAAERQRSCHSWPEWRGTEPRTLHSARAYVLRLKDGAGQRRHWQKAAELLLAAADGGDLEACTRQIHLAIFLDGVLDLKGTPAR